MKTLTIQDLKDNREMIITSITEKVGEENVKAIMATMVGGLDCCDTIEDLIDSAISINEFEARPKKKESKLAAMVCNHELQNDIKYDVVKKEYVKI
jgi:hypothetical protein